MTEHVVFARPVNLTEERVQEMLVKRAKQQAFKEMLDEQIMEAQHSRERSKNTIIGSSDTGSSSSKAEHVNGNRNGKFVSRKLFPANKSSAPNGESQMLANGHNSIHKNGNKFNLVHSQKHSSLKESNVEPTDHEHLELQGTKLTSSTSVSTGTAGSDQNKVININSNKTISDCSDPTTNLAAKGISSMSGSRSRRANDVAIKFNNAPPTRYIFNFENGHGEFIEEKNNHYHDNNNNNESNVDTKSTSIDVNNVMSTCNGDSSGNAIHGSNNINIQSNTTKANEMCSNNFNMKQNGEMNNDRARRERKLTKYKEENQSIEYNSANSKAIAEQECSATTSHDYNSLPISFDVKGALMENSNKRGVVRLVNTKKCNQEDASHDTQSLPINLLYQLNKNDKNYDGQMTSNNTSNHKNTNEHVLINHVLENKLFANGASNRTNGNANISEGESCTPGRDKISNKSSGKESLPRHKLVHSPLRVDKSREISPRKLTEDVANVIQSKELNRQPSSQISLSPHHRLQHLDSPIVSARAMVEDKVSDGVNGLSSRSRISPRRNGRPANGILPPIALHAPQYSANDYHHNAKSNEMRRTPNPSPSPTTTMMNGNTNTSASERSESEARMVIELSAELESVLTNSPRNEVISNSTNTAKATPNTLSITTTNTNNKNAEVKEAVKALGNKQEPPSVTNARGNASPVPNAGVNQVVRLQRALQSREAMVEKMRLKEKSWEEQVKQLKVELRNARQKERHLSRHIAGQKPLPQLNRPNPPVRRAETAPDGSDLIFDSQMLPHPHPPSSFLRPHAPQSTSTKTNTNTSPSSSSSHPVSVGLPNRIKAGQLPSDLCSRRGRVKLDFTKAHIFTPDTFRPITAPDFPEEEVYTNSFTNPPHPPLQPSPWEQQQQQQQHTFTTNNTLSLAPPAQPIATTSPSEPPLSLGMSKANRGKPLTRKAANAKSNKKDNVKVVNTESTLQKNKLDGNNDDDHDDVDYDNIRTSITNSNSANELQSPVEQNKKRHMQNRESWLSVDDSFKLASLNTQQTALGLPRDAAMRPVPIEFKHLLQFVEAQVITHEQANKLWQFWCETKLVNTSSVSVNANEHAVADIENNQDANTISDKNVVYENTKKKEQTSVTNNVDKVDKIREDKQQEKSDEGVVYTTHSELNGIKAKAVKDVHANEKESECEELELSASSSSSEEEEEDKEEEEEQQEEESEEVEEEEEEEEESESEEESEETDEDCEEEEEKEKEATVPTKKHLHKNSTTTSANSNNKNSTKTDVVDVNDDINFDSKLIKTPLDRNVIFTPALRQKIDSKFVSNDNVIKTKPNVEKAIHNDTELM